jgi:hypothetical protein
VNRRPRRDASLCACHHPAKRRWETLVEVVEVLVLAIVAVATSCSGCVAARDYRTAFDAWLKTDPFTNPAMAMPALPRA